MTCRAYSPSKYLKRLLHYMKLLSEKPHTAAELTAHYPGLDRSAVYRDLRTIEGSGVALKVVRAEHGGQGNPAYYFLEGMEWMLPIISPPTQKQYVPKIKRGPPGWRENGF